MLGGIEADAGGPNGAVADPDLRACTSRDGGVVLGVGFANRMK